MCIHRDTQSISHHIFSSVIDQFQETDILILNNTKVIKARLLGHRQSGGAVECFLIEKKNQNNWSALLSPAKRLKINEKIEIAPGFEVEIILLDHSSGLHQVQLHANEAVDEAISKYGNVPLPPYIQPNNQWESRYQTVYAKEAGAVAAPTAGLHFTPELLDQIRAKGVTIDFVTLHVGLGTFLPIKTDNITQHTMHREWYQVTPQTADLLNKARQTHRRVIAVGTTVARTLETVCNGDRYEANSGYTQIFLYPGKEIHSFQGLITNFHLPKSTLLLLVSAFAGTDLVKKAYQIAIEQQYRFYSFGDAMMIIY